MDAWASVAAAVLGAIAAPLFDHLRSHPKTAVLDVLWAAGGPMSAAELCEELRPLTPATVHRALRSLSRRHRILIEPGGRYALPPGTARRGHRGGWRRALPSVAGLVLGASLGLVAADVAATHATATESSVQPLRAIVPQVGDGKAFDYRNDGGGLQARYTKDVDCRRSSRPVGLRLTWDMRQPGRPSGGWGILWNGSPSGSFVASSYKHLVVSVKGAEGGERFQIGLRDLRGREVKLESEELAAIGKSGWTRVAIALDGFAGVERTAIVNVNFGFNRNHGAGQVCIDEIRFA